MNRKSREELVLVADIGGGTSDFSLIRLSPQRAWNEDRREDILANSGVHIGGRQAEVWLGRCRIAGRHQPRARS